MSVVNLCLRQCSRCSKWKNEEDFHRHGPGRRCRRCKACISTIKERYYKKVKPYAFTVVQVEAPDLGFLGRQLSKVVVNILKVNNGQFNETNWSELQ